MEVVRIVRLWCKLEEVFFFKLVVVDIVVVLIDKIRIWFECELYEGFWIFVRVLVFLFIVYE